MNRARVLLGLMLAAVIGCAAEHRPGDERDATSRGDPVGTPGAGADAEAASGQPASADAASSRGADVDAASSPRSGDRPVDAGRIADAGTTAATRDAMRPSAGACQPLVLSAAPLAPEVRIVLDRSQSMAPTIPLGVSCVGYDAVMDQLACSTSMDQAACARVACASIDCTQPPYQGSVVCGGASPSPAVDRWTAAVQGIKSFTQAFQTRVGFGLTVFPGDTPTAPGGSPSADLCAPGSELVPAALNSAAAIARALERTQPSGATPTAAALSAVEAQVKAERSGADAAAPPQFVVLLTDGQPTCPNARGNTLDAVTLAQDHALTLQALDVLRAAGVKSHVFAFVAATDVALTRAAAELAQHGGTDRSHPVQDARSIVEQFDAIAPALTSCSFRIEPRPLDPSYLMVTLDDQRLEWDGADGWVIAGATLTLQGAACTRFNNGVRHRVVIEAECEQLPLSP